MKRKNKIDLVILAGGKGSRIKRFLDGNPKPLLKINRIPFLQILINEYAKYPFETIYILAGFRGNLIYKKFNNKFANFIKIKCFIEKKSLGTAGALRVLRNRIKNDFLVVNGDSYIDLKLHNIFNKKNKRHQIFLTNNKNYKSNKMLSNLSIGSKKNIKLKNNGNLMNAGVYFFKKNIFNLIKNNSFSLEKEILPKLIKKNKIEGEFKNKYFIDIGTEKNLLFARKTLTKYLTRPAAFLDRDGVINYDYGYVSSIKRFNFKKGVIKALNYLLLKKYNIFVITNQAGIAKGKFTLANFFKLQKEIKFILNKKKINFSDVKFCPFHKDGIVKKFRKNSVMRKPNNGMILQLFKTWHIDKKNSFFIGDQKSDKMCAKKSNIYFEYVQNDIVKQVEKIIKNKDIKKIKI